MAGRQWTIRDVLTWTEGYLARHDDEHPKLSAQWLVCDATGHTRVELFLNYDKPLTQAELDHLHEGIERRAAGEPLQYVTGEMPFRHIVLKCERGVLIPRPETEILVDVVLEGLDAMGERAGEKDEAEAAAVTEGDADGGDAEAGDAAPEGPRVLEVGCGTGCIALSIAHERPGTHVIATDISSQAVELARRNTRVLGLEDRVDIVECDLASGVGDELMGTFSALVSNPPYIPHDVLATLPREVVGYEPGLALDGGDDGLDVFRRLLDLAPRALVPGGVFAVELFEESLDEAAALARAQGGWATVEVREDLTHRPRILHAVREV